MNLLALIPARAGSKGIPRKNLKSLAGKPLLAWTVEAACAACCVDRVVLSTDDAEIAVAGKQAGADVPFLRPEILARDETPSLDVVLHALDQLPHFDWVLLLQPTSPLRTAADIEAMVLRCRNHGAPSAVSVTQVDQHPSWMFTLDESERLTPLLQAPLPVRRQDLPELYALNGAMYLARVDWLRSEGGFVGRETLAHVMPAERSADIDTTLDWAWVEYLMNARHEHPTASPDRN